MKKRCLFVVLALCALLILSSACGAVDLTILHVNDFHGRLLPYVEKSIDREKIVGGAAHLAAMISTERSANPRGTILLSAGDMFQGTPISNVFHGEPVLQIMNRLRFDAMAIGNHEFDWGLSTLESWIAHADFPFLSANISDSAGRLLAGVKPYVIVERKGIKIAVIGVTSRDTPVTTKADNVRGLTFLDPVKAVPPLVQEVKEKGAQLVVLLTHIGFEEDERLAAAVPGIDVIVGAHTHTVLRDPLRVGKTIIVQAGYNGLFLGVLNLKMDERTGKIVSFTSQDELKLVKAGPDDPFDKEVAGIAREYQQKIKAVFEQKIGVAAVDLNRPIDGESNLGDIITDAMRASMQADIAIQNSRGIRSDIPKGAITIENVYTAFPFDNVVMAMDLKGTDILSILEKCAAKPGILQFSGLSVRFGADGSAQNRIVEVRAGKAPLDPAKVYRVATNDFLGTGGDGFSEFTKGSRIAFGDSLREVFSGYVKHNSPLSNGVEGRIAVDGK